VDLTSGAKTTLPVPGGRQACFPRWAPRGERIAFVVLEDARWQLATMGVDGRDYKVWTASRPDLRGLWGLIDWSPDGTRLVFKADTQPFASDLFVLDTRDGSLRNLTSDEAYDESPAWTPDGDGVVFMSTRGGDWTWGLFELSLSTSAVTRLTTPDYHEKNHVRRGPRGQIIWTDEGERGRETLVELTPDGARTSRPGLPAGARWASYSTDGARLLFTAVEHRTEYWVAENLAGDGSPVVARADSPAGTAAALDDGRRSPPANEIRASADGPRGRSPVKLDHR
jgi:TolB protein